jgi:hypothetical protein
MTCTGTPDEQHDRGGLSWRTVVGGLAAGVGAAAAGALVAGCDSKGANQAGGDSPPRDASGGFSGQPYSPSGHPTEEPVGGQPPPVPSDRSRVLLVGAVVNSVVQLSVHDEFDGPGQRSDPFGVDEELVGQARSRLLRRR